VAGCLAIVLLFAAGAGFRFLESKVQAIGDKPIELPVPLSAIPLQIGTWSGEEAEIPAVTKSYMERNFADDFISRRYVSEGGLWADLYVVYCSSRPAGILGHRPPVCFPAHGWIRESTTESEAVLRSGRTIKCLIHRFRKPAPAYLEIVVMSFYVVNGEITLTESDFSSFLGRRPNLSGDPARYVAQVQISSVLEHSVRTAASEFVGTVLRFLPDPEGRVKAAGGFDTEGSAPAPIAR